MTTEATKVTNCTSALTTNISTDLDKEILEWFQGMHAKNDDNRGNGSNNCSTIKLHPLTGMLWQWWQTPQPYPPSRQWQSWQPYPLPSQIMRTTKLVAISTAQMMTMTKPVAISTTQTKKMSILWVTNSVVVVRPVVVGCDQHHYTNGHCYGSASKSKARCIHCPDEDNCEAIFIT